MTSIKIEAGCALLSAATNLDPASYLYRFSDEEGDHIVVFTAHRAPKIGDTIENGELVDAILPQSNQDKSKWIKPDSDTWPYNR